MPQKTGENFIAKSVSLPASYWDELEKLRGDADALPLVEVTRAAVNRGIQVMLADEMTRIDLITKTLVQQKLKQRQGDMARLIIETKRDLCTLEESLDLDDTEDSFRVAFTGIQKQLDKLAGYLKD